MKQFKLPKFLICENPMAEGSSETQFILHTQEPQMLAVVLNEFTDRQYQTRHHDDAQIVAYLNPDGLLETCKLVPIVGYGDQFNHSDLAGLMKRMADWWSSYLAYEDEEIDKQGNPLRVADFSPKMEGLKVIADFKKDKYLIIYKGFTYAFECEADSKEYLRTLGFDDDDFANGILNEVKTTKLGYN